MTGWEFPVYRITYKMTENIHVCVCECLSDIISEAHRTNRIAGHSFWKQFPYANHFKQNFKTDNNNNNNKKRKKEEAATITDGASISHRFLRADTDDRVT